MIRRVWASDCRFKPVEFRDGLNIILAERAQNSGNKDTRNGVGKSTFLNIIHFCLGADFNRIALPKDELSEWIFYIDIELNGEIVSAGCGISEPKIIRILSGYTALPVSLSEDSEGFFYKLEDWKKVLGHCLFGISGLSEAEEGLSFRSLFSYFARQTADAYIDPFRFFRNQQSVSCQINNAYLLGLNWSYASEAGKIKEKQKHLKNYEDSLKYRLSHNQGALESARVRIEDEIRQDSEALSSFKVHPQYKEIQEQANRLTSELHELSNSLMIARRKLESYEKSVYEEDDVDDLSVEKLFSEAGVLFSEKVKKTLNDAKEFHRSIIRNRKLFLETEITLLKNKMFSDDEKLKALTEKRAKYLQVLKTHGALDEYSQLQKQLQEKVARLEFLKNQIDSLKNISRERNELKASKMELEKKIKRDYEQMRPEWEKAVKVFNDNSQALYSQPGDLIINIKDYGYEFDVVIQKSGSDGIKKMKIFCYDLMLVELMSDKGKINFLYHDSNIFDGVDGRQIANALMLANKKSRHGHFQYICALNSDVVPFEYFSKEFDFNSFVVRSLKDQPASESTLGFRFEVDK